MLERICRKVWYDRNWLAAAILLLPLAALYFIAWKARDLYYGCRPGRSRKLGCRVISAGNISVGGTGKTPFIIFLIEHLIRKGITDIVVLTRGYKGEKTGLVDDSAGYADEARMIRAKFSSVRVIAGSDRYANFRKYEKEHSRPQVVILDDGFQHRKIERDVDIVMADGAALFGNGFLLPAGPLREPAAAVADRADAVFLKDAGRETVAVVENLFRGTPVFNFALEGIQLFDSGGAIAPREELKGKDIVAFCGIGNPGSFRRTLEREAITVKEFIALNDHMNYDRDTIASITSSGADIYLTTGKDAVKLSGIWPDGRSLLVVEPRFTVEGNEWERILG